MLATVCGYTFDEIDRMTMAEFNELCAYWGKHPPAHVLIAAYVGYKPRVIADKSTDPGELFRLLGADPEKGGAMRILH